MPETAAPQDPGPDRSPIEELPLAESSFKAGKPYVFFASRIPGMEDVREELAELSRDRGLPLWLAGYSSPDLNSLPLEEVQIACMERVREARKVICVLNGTYGSPLDLTETCILELEIAMAVLSRRDMTVLLVEPFELDGRLKGLLDMVQTARPEVLDAAPRSKGKIVEAVAAICGQVTEPPPPQGGRGLLRSFGRLVQFLASERTGAYSRERLDVFFLDGRLVPLPGTALDKERIALILETAEAQSEAPNRLAYLWTAIRHLSAAPYDSPRYRDFVPLWHRALGRWASASAWYGLHGHFFLGRLAAANTLVAIRERLATQDDGEVAIQDTGGAIASEYYSIAKLVPNLWHRRKLLRRALENVELALEQGQPEPAGLLTIRGSIHLALGEGRQAVADYRQSLAIRRRGGSEAGIGEGEVDLGLAYLFVGLPWKSGPLLESGIAKLRSAGSREFLVKSLRKLSLFYQGTLRGQRAAATLGEALELARKHKLQGQIDQILKAMERRR